MSDLMDVDTLKV